LRRFRVWWLPRLRRLRRLRGRWLLVWWLRRLRWLRGLCGLRGWRGLLRLLGSLPFVLRRALQFFGPEAVLLSRVNDGS
jgi:hypothetical protein